MPPIESTRFPRQMGMCMVAADQNGAIAMSDALNAGTGLSSSGLRPSPHRAADTLGRHWARIGRALCGNDYVPTNLNSKQLADIGETTSEAPPDPFDPPLGLIGGQQKVDGLPLFAHPSSRLG